MNLFNRRTASAIDALQCLYQHDRRMKHEELCALIGQDALYLRDVMNQLRFLGFVSSFRGPEGGYIITPYIEHQTLSALLEHLKELAPRRLIPGRASDDAYKLVRDTMDSITLLQVFGGDKRHLMKEDK